jgi:hypothetical protein
MRKQEEHLAAGLKALADGETVFSTINRNKLLSMGYGAVDNVLQAAVFEIAAATTMARGPVLVDESWQDIAWDITRNALVGGVLGGGIEALWTNGTFKRASKVIDAKSRDYDVHNALEKLNLPFGDNVFKIAEEALNLPREVLENARLLDFEYVVNGRKITTQLPVGSMLDRKVKETVDKTLELFQARITNFAADDTSIGAPVARAMMEIVREGLEQRAPREQIFDQLGGYLHHLRGLQVRRSQLRATA